MVMMSFPGEKKVTFLCTSMFVAPDAPFAYASGRLSCTQPRNLALRILYQVCKEDRIRSMRTKVVAAKLVARTNFGTIVDFNQVSGNSKSQSIKVSEEWFGPGEQHPWAQG